MIGNPKNAVQSMMSQLIGSKAWPEPPDPHRREHCPAGFAADHVADAVQFGAPQGFE